MAFCDEDEDTVSMVLTALHGLLDKHGIDPSRIGRRAAMLNRRSASGIGIPAE